MNNGIYIHIKKESIFFYIAFLCISFYSLMEMSTSSLVFMSNARMYIIWIATFCCICLTNEFISLMKENTDRTIIFFTVLFTILVFGGWYFGGKLTDIRHIYRIIAYFYDLLVLSTVIVKDNRAKQSIKLLLSLCILLCIFNDFVDLTGIITFPRPQASVLKLYVIGTKFDVVYLHINTMALYLTNEFFENRFSKKKISIIILSLLVIFGLAIYVDCSTGIIGSIIYALLFSLTFLGNDKIRTFFFSKYTFIATFLLATIVFLVLQQIVNLPIVADFVVNKLDRDLTLTGRLIIFMLFIPVMSGHWLWGYGLSRAYSVSMQNFGAADAQNLVLQWLLQIGIIPVIPMLVLLMCYFGRNKLCNNKKVLLPISILLYTYILLGIGEITLNYNFFLFITLLAGISNSFAKEE